MAVCPNCNAILSCGCQKRTASDKKQVCSNCVRVYEAHLKEVKSQTSVITAVVDITKQPSST